MLDEKVDVSIERRYKILRYIGGGAYGIVWKAVDRVTQERVALKKVVGAFSNATDAQRTYREVAVLTQSRHPNIVSLLRLHHSSSGSDLYLVFELMESDLALVIRSGMLHGVPSQIPLISLQLFRALRYLHQRHLLHRDVKPANLLVCSNGHVKLGDFGLARKAPFVYDASPNPQPIEVDPALWSVSGKSEARGRAFSEDTPMASPPSWHSDEGDAEAPERVDALDHEEDDAAGATMRPMTSYIATRWYRAPEVLSSTKEPAVYSSAVDLWAAGCVIAEAFVGHPLFPGRSTAHQLELIRRAVCLRDSGDRHESESEPPPLKTQLAAVAPPLAVDLMVRLLDWDPAARISAAAALRHPFVATLQTPWLPQEETAENGGLPVVLEGDEEWGPQRSEDYRRLLLNVERNMDVDAHVIVPN